MTEAPRGFIDTVHTDGSVTLRFRNVIDYGAAPNGAADVTLSRAEFDAMRASLAEAAPSLSRIEALAEARKHVDALATNARGYQDGVRFGDKVAAVERTARFLLREESDD